LLNDSGADGVARLRRRLPSSQPCLERSQQGDADFEPARGADRKQGLQKACLAHIGRSLAAIADRDRLHRKTSFHGGLEYPC
jgi:hypothetical protein